MLSQIREACKNAKTLNMADFNYTDTSIDLDKNILRTKGTNVIEKAAKDLFSKQCAALTRFSGLGLSCEWMESWINCDMEDNLWAMVLKNIV